MASRGGAVLVLIGLVAVGASVLYANNAMSNLTTPQEVQQAAQVARDASNLQGTGWIVAGLGFGASLYPRQDETGSLPTAERPRPEIDLGPPDADLPPPLKD